MYGSRHDLHHPSLYATPAISAMDMALWDIAGKASNQPIYNLLGGKYHENLLAYAYMPSKGIDKHPEKAGDVAAPGVVLQDGDILLLRTGWPGWYRSLTLREADGVGARPYTPGLEGTVKIAAWLWNHRVAAIASDNPALERTPGEPREEGYLHRRVLPALGLAIGELWLLDPIAEACAADGHYACLLASAPFNLPGGVGSPPNALAIR